MRYRLLTIAIVACLIFSLTGLALASPIQDINHWAKTQIEKWLAQGIASGYPDNTFKPDNTISRAEFVSLANRAFGRQNQDAAITFKDVRPSDWFFAEVAAARAAGYISGYEDGTFRPDNPVTRQEAASIAARLLKLESTSAQFYFKDAENISPWARAAVYAVAANKVMSGYTDGTFRPYGLMTRAETVVMLDSALDFLSVEPEEGLTGHIYIDGKAAEGAVIKLFEKGKYTVIKETTADGNGEYVFAVDAGEYDITAVKDNYMAYVSDLIVTDKLVKDITLSEGTVFKGQAVDKSGNAMKNATLTFTTNPIFITTTDEDGNFIITVLPGMDYTIGGGSGLHPITGVGSGGPGVKLLGTLRFGGSPGGGGGSGGGGPAVPQASNFEMAGASFTGSGLSYTVNIVPETTKVKELKFDLNVNSDFEITDLINQAGINILPSLKTLHPAIKTTGSVTAGTGRVINIVDLLAIPDPEDDGIAASYFAQLVNPGHTTGTMTIKIRLVNSASTSKQAIYTLTVNIKKNEIPVATNFQVAGATFTGTGTSYTVDVLKAANIKNIKFDLNVDSDFEIIELLDNGGTDKLAALKGAYLPVKTTGSVTPGTGKNIDIITLLAIPDPESDGVKAGNFCALINGTQQSSMTIKIKLTNGFYPLAHATYILNVNVL